MRRPINLTLSVANKDISVSNKHAHCSASPNTEISIVELKLRLFGFQYDNFALQHDALHHSNVIHLK